MAGDTFVYHAHKFVFRIPSSAACVFDELLQPRRLIELDYLVDVCDDHSLLHVVF